MKKPKILVILGPTATGKSDLAVKLAKDFNGEIISADCRQTYQGLDLGSGKITKKEMGGIPHYLLDVISPKKVFSVIDFQKKAYLAIEHILQKNKLPIVVGGTAFYIQSIVEGLILPEVKPDQVLRKKLALLKTEELVRKLTELDPQRAQEIDLKNRVRLIRAIEISSQIGKIPRIRKVPKFNCLQIGLNLPKKELAQKIELRLKKRMKKGMLAEAKKLHAKGLSWKKMESFGLEYKFMAQFLQKKITKIEMLAKIQISSEQLAKRQMTWFKKDKKIKWFGVKKYSEIQKIVKSFLK